LQKGGKKSILDVEVVMKMKFFLILLIAMLASAASGATGTNRRWTAELEAGAVFSGTNVARIPNAGGTLFSLSGDLDIPAEAYFRLRLSYAISRRHELSLLYAPLTLNASGHLPADVSFTGVLFPKDTAVEGVYTFNSYRLTYRYRLLDKPRLRLDIGLTAKIRDAEIALTSATLSASKTNVGFVPLLHARLDWDWSSKLGLLVEVDAAAAKQGRAEDVLLALRWKLSPRWLARLGYRFVEGGADVDEVYNFAWIHYIAAGLAFNF
jgi:opacity protein-like surface antigen